MRLKLQSNTIQDYIKVRIGAGQAKLEAANLIVLVTVSLPITILGFFVTGDT